jgi:hypothetical protein
MIPPFALWGLVIALVIPSVLYFMKVSRDKYQDSASEILAEKKNLLPLIEELIDWIPTCDGSLGSIRFEIKPRLSEPVRRFRLHLKGARLRAFNDTWEVLANTTREEVWNRQPNTTDEQYDKAKETLKTRLEALRKIVHAA